MTAQGGIVRYSAAEALAALKKFDFRASQTSFDAAFSRKV
jgi:hypothetical protein